MGVLVAIMAGVGVGGKAVFVAVGVWAASMGRAVKVGVLVSAAEE